MSALTDLLVALGQQLELASELATVNEQAQFENEAGLRQEVAAITAHRDRLREQLTARLPRLAAKLDSLTPEGVAGFEAKIGRRLDAVVTFGSDQHWSDATGDLIAGRFWLPRLAKMDRPVIFSWPLCPRIAGTPMAEVVAGKRDAEFVREAKLLNGWRAQDEEILIRLAWEMNGITNGKPWFEYAREGAAVYVAAFRRIVPLIRQHCPRARIVWCPTLQHNTVAGTEAFWPGDEFVDVVSADLYAVEGVDGLEAWRRASAHPVNLRWLIAFALVHDKRFALDEVACTPQQGAFIDALADVLALHRPLHLGLWGSGAKYSGVLSGESLARFVARFGPEA